jgi:Domain of unknown function (DUF2017)
MSRFRPPVRRTKQGYIVRLDDSEVALLRRLLAELRSLLLADPVEAGAVVTRLFPVAHPDDPEREAEYQRLMREELVASRLEAINAVDGVLAEGRPLDDAQITAFMQSVNAVRLVLGTMLGVTDDPDAEVEGLDEGSTDSAEYHLYGYLSWLLEWTVRAQS